jgi:tetratricopeptide (TPR) repeat protein
MTLPRRIGCLILVLRLATVTLSAHQDPPRPEEKPSSPPAGKVAPSITFERQHMRVRFENDGKSSREMTMHVRANDDAGVRQAGQIPLLYASSSEDLSITKLEVHKKTGSVVAVGADAVQDHAVQPNAQTPMFIDLRQKSVTVPALQPGDLVVITAVWSVTRPFAGKHSWYGHTFVKHAVVNDERLELDVPRAMEPIIRTAPGAPAEQNGGNGRVADGRRLYVWQTSNPEVPKGNDPLESEEAALPDIRVTTFRDWQEFAEWLQPLMHPAADGAVREKALELTKGLANQEARIEALYQFVATQIRYVSLSIGLNRYAPHAPGDVLRQQYGDCKDKHALLAAMLEAIGLGSLPVLVNTERSISEDLPSPAEFDHVITAVPNGKDPSTWTWLDTTLEVAPAGLLTRETRGRRALALGDRARAPQVVTTPDDGPFPFADVTFVKAKVNPLGVLTAGVTFTARGDTELVLRSVLRAMPRESLDEFGKGFAAAIGFEGEISKFAFSDPLATRDPLELTFSVRKAGYLDWAADESTIAAPTGKLDTSTLDPDRTPLKADRKVPTSTALRRTLTIQLPPGYTAAAPVGVRAAKDAFVYTSRYDVNGSVLSVERTLEGQPRRLLVADAPDYARIARSIASDLAQTFKVARVQKTVPEVPADMSAAELYSAAYSAFNARDYETSVTLWERVIAADAKMTSALNGLGWAYQRLKRYDKAIETLEKQRALEPTNKKINSDLGYVYKEAGRLEEAAAAYARHLAAEPLDGPKHQVLGEIYADLDRHADAVASLDRAVLLVNDDPWLQQQRGRSLLALGRTADGLAAFDAALKQGSSAELQSAIAWVLADRGIEPDRAIGLSRSAIGSIAERMSGATADGLTTTHFDLMERLAWAWDALGMVQLRKGQVDEAISSFEAAWQLGATSSTAMHLAQTYEKKERRADAASYYLIARALDPTPDAELQTALKRLFLKADIERLLEGATRQAAIERGVKVDGKTASQAHAQFNAVLDRRGRVLDISYLDGDKALADFGSLLRKAQFRLTAVGGDGVRIAARIRLACDTNACYANVQPPRHVQ